MAHNGKHALITGSSRGIGRGIALKLAERGVRVAINYRKNEAAAKDTLAKVRQAGSDGFTVQADVCRAEDIARMVGRAKQEFGTLDIFVSNARPDVPEFYQGPMSITMGQWDTAMNSQAKAFLLAVREVCPLMGDDGRIIAITYAPGGRTGSWQPWVGMGAAKVDMESVGRHSRFSAAKVVVAPPGSLRPVIARAKARPRRPCRPEGRSYTSVLPGRPRAEGALQGVQSSDAARLKYTPCAP